MSWAGGKEARRCLSSLLWARTSTSKMSTRRIRTRAEDYGGIDGEEIRSAGLNSRRREATLRGSSVAFDDRSQRSLYS
eukprot:6685884-Pyramimonas_sp.AAC.1